MAMATTTAKPKLENREELMSNILAHKYPATATYPKGVTVADLVGMIAGSEKHSVLEKVLAALQAHVPLMLIGGPGNGKTALVNMVAKLIGAEAIWFSPNSAPSSMAVPGVARRKNEAGEEVDYIEYLLVDKMRSDKPKIIVFDEISRMSEVMRQQALEVIAPPHAISGNVIPNVVGVLCTGNRVEDGVDALDPALATRLGATVEVRAAAMPWKYFVSAEFAEVDLTEAFRVHDRFDPVLREQVTPRKFRKLIWNLLNFGCGWTGLAMTGDDDSYEKFTDASGNDVTADVIRQLAEVLGTPNRAALADKTEALIAALTGHDRQTVYAVGAMGIGKTSYFRDEIMTRRPNAKVMVISMANAAPEDWMLTTIHQGTLKQTLLEFFRQDGEKYLIADEVWRASEDVRDMLLEVFQEGTVGGIDAGLKGILALNNPRTIEGYSLDVGTPDTAQADRFTVNVKLTAQDIPWKSYIIGRYAEVSEHFVQWWDGLSARDQVLYPPRQLESAIRWYNTGMPLEDTKPWYDGMPLDISFLELERALADRPLVKIRDVAAKCEEYASELTGPDGQTGSAHRSVFDAFDRSDVVQLREHRAVCERLMPLLSQQAKINLLRSAKEKRRFWLSVVNGEAEDQD
jgi:MoxR-like ATPase